MLPLVNRRVASLRRLVRILGPPLQRLPRHWLRVPLPRLRQHLVEPVRLTSRHMTGSQQLLQAPVVLPPAHAERGHRHVRLTFSLTSRNLTHIHRQQTFTVLLKQVHHTPWHGVPRRVPREHASAHPPPPLRHMHAVRLRPLAAQQRPVHHPQRPVSHATSELSNQLRLRHHRQQSWNGVRHNHVVQPKVVCRAKHCRRRGIRPVQHRPHDPFHIRSMTLAVP
mmetsp:Transcript_7781/g.24960  ORF Transcript_7781/g.24960 Transcript_7781/m.24960 type:complete len:223 (+) Transcript_7781:1053-1721(+)